MRCLNLHHLLLLQMLSSILFGMKKRERTAPDNMRSLGVFPLTSINAAPLGLKTITDSSLDSPRRSNCVKRAFITASLSPPAINDRGMGCKDEEEDDDDDNACWATYGWRNPCRRRFPPPIPLLARTGNLTSHMPWVLKRIYKDDGSLVIQEIPVEHHEYFRARRRNGRLTLQLIELDDLHQSEEMGIETEEMEKGDGLSSSSPHCYEEEELITQCDETTTDFESIPVMRSPWLASSSLPEPICGTETLEKEGGRPLHLQLPLSRMRMVHG